MSTLPSEFGPLVRELHTRAAEQCQPINGTFELTERCNLACHMCYVCQGVNSTTLKSSEISAKQWLEIAHQAAAGGLIFLLLTGGEPLLRPDFFEIYTPLTTLGLQIILYSNGTLITDSIAARLSAAPPSRTAITLYGATAETYEAVTGVPGSYEKCISGIKALIKHKVPLALRTTLTKINVHELEAMQKIAYDFNLPISTGWLLTRRRDGKQLKINNYRLPAKKCIEIETTDRAAENDWTEFAHQGLLERPIRNFYCNAGSCSFYINARGEMNTCIDLEKPAAKPLEKGFNAAWNEVKSFVDNAPQIDQACLNCKAYDFCPRCPAWSELETGTLTKPVPYLCELAFTRKAHYDNNE